VADGEYVSERRGHPVIRIQQFNLHDAFLVCQLLPAAERDVYARLHGEVFDAERAAAWAYNVDGLKWVFDIPAAPVAIGGFIPVTPGTFRTWFYATERAWRECGKELTEAVAGLIREALKLAHRVETVTLADQEKARTWYPRIGLEFESTLRGYGANGEAAAMYVALRDAEKL
jgi:hypothetical protein